MTLEKKTIVELRAIAQSVGLVPDFGVSREQLLQDIAQHAGAKIVPPTPPIQVNINFPSEGGMTQVSIRKALENFEPLGLALTFPDERTWHMYCNKRNDSGSMSMSIWSIVQCAKALVQP